MKNIHQNAIKYLTYNVLNKNKLENEQATSQPPLKGEIIGTPLEPTSQSRHNSLLTTKVRHPLFKGMYMYKFERRLLKITYK